MVGVRAGCDSAQPGAGLALPPVLLDAFLKSLRVRGEEGFGPVLAHRPSRSFCSRGGGGGEEAGSGIFVGS